MKLTLTYVASKPQVSAKTGKPYVSQSLKATEYGDRFLSGFQSKDTANWKVGDTVEVEVKESDKMDKTGKPYLNWSVNKAESPVMERIAKIEFSISNIHRKIDEMVKYIKMKEDNGLTSAGTKVPDFKENTPEEAQKFGDNMVRYETDEFGDANAELESLVI